MKFAEAHDRWQKAVTNEVRRLARTKKMDAAPASAFPVFARLLDVTDFEEDIRPRLKCFLQEVEQMESETRMEWPLGKPAMALFGLTPRSEHKGIGPRQKLAAPLRCVTPSSMRRAEASLAIELGLLLFLAQVEDA